MRYFVRYINEPEHARYDLERGYSFYGYQLYDSYEKALESDMIEYQGFSEDDIATICINNVTKYGFRLAGLSGFGDFETREEAKESIEAFGSFSFAAIFSGSYSTNDPDSVGCLFRPSRVIEIVEVYVG